MRGIKAWIRKILGVPGIEQVERILGKLTEQILNEQQEEIEKLRHELGIDPPSPFKPREEPPGTLVGGEPSQTDKTPCDGTYLQKLATKFEATVDPDELAKIADVPAGAVIDRDVWDRIVEEWIKRSDLGPVPREKVDEILKTRAWERYENPSRNS